MSAHSYIERLKLKHLEAEKKALEQKKLQIEQEKNKKTNKE